MVDVSAASAIGQHLDAHVVKARNGNGTDIITVSLRKTCEIDALSHRYIPQDLEVLKKVFNSRPVMLVSCARDKSREHSIGMFNSSLAFPSILAFWGVGPQDLSSTMEDLFL